MFDQPVSRWLRVRKSPHLEDAPFEVDDDGFLSAWVGTTSFFHVDSLIRPEDALAEGALVLLGEPGSGKTTTFRTLTDVQAEHVDPDPGQPGTVWVTGSELSDKAAFDDLVGVHLRALPAVGGDLPPQEPLMLVIDQLDESANLRAFASHMKRALERRDTRSLRVLVACRTADYQSELTGVLKQALGGCAVADLAPLTRADVATLAEGEGVDGEAFVEAVAATGVGLLASIPLTLQILLPVYKENPAFLNEDSLKLFGRGVLRLADEPDRGRASIGSAVNSPEQRVVIASRIAARVVLAGQRTIRTGDVASAGPDDVTSGILAGGSEELTDPFAVTNAAVDGTLRTALFSRTGPDHVAFAHSSFAAFLSARYLATRMRGRAIEARRQLAGVFLVAAPDEDTASIPVYLRETAAWLLAHAPGDYHWLAQADPQGLMAHSAHITDPAVRRLIVDGLLRRAEEVEFSAPPWQRTRWRIDHPGMGAQLHAVLDGATATSSSVWPQFAKTRLALHLARHCSDTSLVEPLLTVAENPDQQTDLRQIAAQSAMHVSPDRAVPRLRILLASLVDEHTDDPTERDELIGVLLSLLWPQYLLLSEVLVHVHPVADPLFFGDYRMQITRLPDQVPDSGLDELVRFARDVAADALHVADGEPLLGRDNVEVAGRMVAASRSRSERAVRDVVVPILDRVTTCETPGEHLPVVVELLVGLRQVSARLPLPAGLTWVDPRGEEPVVVRDLRRQVTEDFTRNLLAHVEHFTRAHAYLITGRWKAGQRSGTPKTAYLAGGIGERTQLIDSHDVAWLLERAARHRADGDDDLGEALVIIASDVADLSDPAILELVYELHGTPDWQHFPWLQDAGSAEQALSRATTAVRPAQSKPWANAAEHEADQRRLLRAAAEGDTQSFDVFVQRLRIDPDTGYGSGVAVYDLFSLPGAALWPEDELLSQAGPAALHYLTAEHDHRDSWLGTDTHDSRAEAGYAALAILHRNSDLDALQHDRWASWIGAVLAHAHLRENPEFEPAISELFNRVVEHASVELASVITRLVRASLAARRGSWRIPHVASMLPPSLHQVLLDLACEINSALDEHAVDESDNNAPSPSAPVADPITAAEQPIPPLTTRQDRQEAIDAWAALLYQPLAAHTPAAVQLATGILARRDDIDHATAAGRALLISDATGSWPQVHAAVGESAEFAKQLAIACASVEHHNSRSGGTALLETLDDEELTNAYLWIASVCPPDTEEFRRGFQAATDEHQLHQWRNRLLQILSERGTAAAVNGIGAISAVYPDDLRIKEARVTARRRAQARGTLRLTPIEVISLLNDPRKRVLNTALQLAELIRDTLEEIDRDLFAHGHLLWDRERLPVPDDAPPRTKRQLAWRPKPEGTLAAYISHELKLRLERRDIVVNREVVVRPTDEGDSGERPDILVESTTDDRTFAHPKIITVPIEIKGSWHEAVLDAQRSQLVDQYLIATHSDAGVYLVGWYPFELWDAEDDAAKRKARRHGTPDKLQSLLSEQAIQIRKETRKHTIPFIVTVTRPASATLTDDLDTK